MAKLRAELGERVLAWSGSFELSKDQYYDWCVRTRHISRNKWGLRA